MRGRYAGSATRSRLIGRRGVRQAPPGGPDASLRPPADLPKAARRVWERDAPLVAGRLKASDVPTFVMACRVTRMAEALLARAEAAVETATGDKTPMVVWAACKAVRIATELRRPVGLSPVDRQRLHVEPAPEEEDDLARFRRENPRG
jgi:phage terminase small subunit